MMFWFLFACSSKPIPLPDVVGYAWVDRQQAQNGEAIELTVTAHHVPNLQIEFEPPSSETLRIVSMGPMIEQTLDNRLSKTSMFRIKGFQGSHLLNPGSIVASSPSGFYQRISTEVVFVDFGEVSISSEIDFSVQYPTDSNQWYWLVLCPLLGLLYVAYRALFIRRKKAIDSVSPLREWSQIVRTGADNHGIAVGLSKVFRGYLAKHYLIEIDHLSPLELAGMIQKHPEMDAIQKKQSLCILSTLDRIKYAGQVSTDRTWIAEVDSLFERFSKVVEEDAEALQ